MSEVKSIKLSYVLSEACILDENDIECLSLIALGYTNPEMAKIFIVSVGTVKMRIKNVLYKLSAVDRTHAVTLGFLHQILNNSVINTIMAKYNLEPRYVERLV